MVLDALAAFAWLQAQAGEHTPARQWLALVEHHPASTHKTRRRVQTLHATLATTVDPTLMAEAQAQGRHLAQHAPVALLRQLAA